MLVFPGFSDTDLAAMNPDTADLLDRLDVSTSSIDMTYTSLAMHEEKDSEISGVGELTHSSSDQCPGAFMCRLKLIKTVFGFLLYRAAGGQRIALIIRRQPDWATRAELLGSDGPHLCCRFFWRFVWFRRAASRTISPGHRIHAPTQFSHRV